VVIENGGGGSRAAAPVARKIFDAFFAAEGYVAREP
jgi:cell division protein FtsI/penicillin-binding protein 2